MNRRYMYTALSIFLMFSLFPFSTCTHVNELAHNLALGKTPAGTCLADFSNVLNVPSDDNPNDWGMLTDGIYGDKNGWSYPATWLKMSGNFGRELVIDLGQIDTVNSMSIGFGQRLDTGVFAPPFVKYYTSIDGSSYSYIGKAQPDVPLYVNSTTNVISDVNIKKYKLDKLPDGKSMNIQARYVKLVFYIDRLCWADEIEITGSKGIVNGAAPPKPREDETTAEVNKYPAKFTEEAAGIGDQFLLYTGPYKDKEITNWTKEKMMEILGYKNKNGDIKDWFFDNILVLPVVKIINPSGVGVFASKADCENFLDFIFKDDSQLGAVNSAAKELNKKLGTDKKVKIDMAVPVPTQNVSCFGDVKGDGPIVSFNPNDFMLQVDAPNSTEGRIKMFSLAMDNKIAAIKWYVDEVERRFKAAGYDNLELTSYYLYNESLDPIEGEDQWAEAAGDYIKSKGYYYTWIPYLGAMSPIMWKDMGFTTASFQPNYAFGGKKRDVISTVAGFAKKYGLGVEMEYGWGAPNPVLARRFAEYLNDGIFLDYMKETYHNYYLNAASIIESESSDDPVFRALYDRIYDFTKEKYVPRFVLEDLSPDITDKSNIVVPVKILNATNFMNGDFTILYDPSKVDYKNSAAGEQLDGIGSVNADVISPGVIKVDFKVDDPQNALYGDMDDTDDKTGGKAEIVRLYFSKRTGVEENSITVSEFATDRTGTMKDRDGNIYLNWSEDSDVTGSMNLRN